MLTDYSVLWFDSGIVANPKTNTRAGVKPTLKIDTTNQVTEIIVYIKVTSSGGVSATAKIVGKIGCGSETITATTQAAASIDLGADE